MTRMQQPDLVVRAHNVHNGSGQPDRAARAFVDAMVELGVHVGVVAEAKALVWPLRNLARQDKALRLVAETPLDVRRDRPVPEQGDTVLIVRDVVARSSRTKVMTRSWVVRQYQRWHDPRRDQLVMLRDVVRGVWGTHLPPGGPDDPVNGPAWREQMNSALAWAGRGGCRAVVGDVNCSRARLEEYIAAYSGRRKRRVRTAVVVGQGVDLCIVIGGTAAGADLEHGGSDHRAQLYAITATGTRAAMRRWIKKTLRKLRRR